MGDEYRVTVKRPVVVEDWVVEAESRDEAVAAVMNKGDKARLVLSDASPAEIQVVSFREMP